MRKWMRERLKRRKKSTSAEASEPKAAPLQPAYFDDDSQNSSAESHDEQPYVAVGTDSSEPLSEPAQADSSHVGGETSPAPHARQKPNRRRRGGRGGRGRAGNQRSSRPEAAPAIAIEDIAPEGTEQGGPVVARSQAPKGTVVLAVGLPGSGKSSWFKRHNINPLSSDMLRALLFDDATEQRFQDLIFSNLRSMLKARLIARRPITYVDATNLTPQDRHS